MNFNFGNFTASVNGASVVIDTALAGKGDVKMTFDPAFNVETVYLSEVPANFKGAVDNWLGQMADGARVNAQVEGLTYEQAWEDYFEERHDALVAAAARRMKRGKEFVPHGEKEPRQR